MRARVGVEHFYFSKDALVSHELATTHFLSSSTGGKLHLYTHYSAETYQIPYADTDCTSTIRYSTR
jgi:hypothetical protein